MSVAPDPRAADPDPSTSPADPLADPVRLAALRCTGLLADDPVPGIDRLARLAAESIGAEVRLSLIDETRQLFKTTMTAAGPVHGPRATPVGMSFCQNVVREAGTVVIRDATRDGRVAASPLAGPGRTMAYLGVPVRDPDGQVLGSFCALAPSPRNWTPRDAATLADFASAVETEIQLRVREARYRESEARYRAYVEQAIDPIVVLDGEGCLRFVSPAFCAIVGRPPESLLGRKAFSLVHPDDRAEGKRAITSAAGRPGAVERNELRLAAADGGWRVVEAHGRALAHADGRAQAELLIHLRDVTARRAVEEALRESEARYRRLFEQNPQPMWVIDRDTLRFLAVNDAAVAHYGWSREEFLTMRAHDIRPPEDVPALVESTRRREPGKPAGVFRHRTRAGAVLEVEVRSHDVIGGEWPNGRLVMVRDVTARRRMAAALAESEARFREMAEHVDAVFYLISADFDTLHYVSPKLETIWGQPTSQFYERPSAFLDAVHPDDRARVLAAATNREAGYAEEYRIVRPDGSVRWISDRGRPIRDESGVIVRYAGVSSDITHRKLADAALRESEARFRALSAASPVGIFAVDQTGSLLYHNARTEEILGVDGERLRERNWLASIHPDDLDTHLADFERASRTGTPFDAEYRVVRPDGEIRWVHGRTAPLIDERGTSMGLVGTVEDVSVRHAQAAALEASERRYRTLVDLSPDMIGVHAGGIFRYVNPAAVAHLGAARPEDLVGRSVLEVVHSDDHPLVHAQVARAAAHPETSAMPSLRFVRGDGSVFEGDLAGGTIEFDGRPARMVVVRDVTAQRAAERTLAEARDAAERSARLTTEFLANVSHEIRTPLHAAIGATSLLVRTTLSPVQRELVDATATASDSLLGIINDILDVSKIEAGMLALEEAPVRLAEQVEAIVRQFRPAATEKGLTLRSVVDAALAAPEAPLVLVDAARLRQVLANLVGNAIKFTSEGQVEVCAASVSSRAGGLTVELRVRDSGIGIPPEQQERVFERFTQADTATTRRFGGTGLGLAISRQIVERMGGAIAVESAPGEGSTFRLTLPLRVAEPVRPATERSVRPRAPGDRGGRVLVVDDTATSRVVTARLLERLGCDVTRAASGAEACARVAAGDVDLVLMDCQMPEMDGYEATRRIRDDEVVSGRPPIPILALTAHALEGDAERCFEAGMDDYLTKPVTLEALEGALAEWIPVGDSEAFAAQDDPHPCLAHAAA